MSTVPSTPPRRTDAQLDAAIARAERRRAVLERLTEIGMAMAEEIGSRTVDAPLHPEPRHDPCRGFAVVSRAVRLTVALEARIEAEIVAMRNGKPLPVNAARDGGPAFAPVADASPCPRRARVREAVWGAINQEIGDIETAREALDRVHESLIEREDYDAVLSLPWRESVAVVCADLGLNPDWSRWSDEEGFARNETGAGYDWPRFWSYDPEQAKERRKRRAERAAGGANRVSQLE